MEQIKKIYRPEPNYKTITIKTSDGSTIQGKVNLQTKQRISDLFTKDEAAFIVLIDVFFKDLQGKTLFINKNHIVWVEPEDK
ncbi:MAG: hypothetical protein JRD93_00590 [Deltaproteobacteria bacterium]|nr:hypothetical protein [Deltaproteobacteria bacterium]MBW2660500.1 hypothetical protein [Deltaproteobacteria bacterium]